MHDKITNEMEVQVRCKLGHTRWVAWEHRHSGKHLGQDGYAHACCRTCPTGSDHTTYEGVWRWKSPAS
jgi:hypothetical protein